AARREPRSGADVERRLAPDQPLVAGRGVPPHGGETRELLAPRRRYRVVKQAKAPAQPEVVERAGDPRGRVVAEEADVERGAVGAGEEPRRRRALDERRPLAAEHPQRPDALDR